jgi:hypothetical protein
MPYSSKIYNLREHPQVHATLNSRRKAINSHHMCFKSHNQTCLIYAWWNNNISITCDTTKGTPQPTVAHPSLRTAHVKFSVGHYPLSAIGTYSASTTPRAKGGGSSCAHNRRITLMPELKADQPAPPAHRITIPAQLWSNHCPDHQSHDHNVANHYPGLRGIKRWQPASQ